MVKELLRENSDHDVLEVHQVYQGNCSPLIAEATVQTKDHGDLDVLFSIRFHNGVGSIAIYEHGDDMMTKFVQYVEDCN